MQSRLLNEKQTEKLSQIIQNFFIKSAHVIVSARTVSSSSNEFNFSSPTSQSQRVKTSKWFNLELIDSYLPKDELLLWKSKNILKLPPLVIETVLDIRGLDTNQTLMLGDTIVKTTKKTEIVLERWLVQFDLQAFDNDNLELANIYKKIIVMMRVLDTLVRLLPSYKLKDKLTNSKPKTNAPVIVKSKVLDGSKPIISRGRIGLSKKIMEHEHTEEHLKSKVLEPILTPIGALKLSVSYRNNCNFQINDNEELLSSQFMLERLRDREPEPIEATEKPLRSPSPVEHHKHRISTTIFRSNSPRRRSSTRSIPLFKAGSLASSASPPPLNASLLQLQVQQPLTSTYSTSKPIPVTVSKTNSAASLAATLRQHRESLPKSISSTNNYYVANSGGSAERLINAEGTPSSQPMASTSSKFASSFGSRFRNPSSRHNSIDSHVLSNPTLQNFRNINKSFSGSPPDPTNSLYIDDDIDSFMRLIDSRPDLRFSSHTTSLYEDSLNNFKSMKKTNDFLNFDSGSIAPSRSNESNPETGYQPSLTASLQLQLQKEVPLKKNFSISQSSRRGSTSSTYSPSSQILKAPAPSSVVMTPAHSHANRFSASPNTQTALTYLKRRSSTASTASHINIPSISEAIENSTNQQQSPSLSGSYQRSGITSPIIQSIRNSPAPRSLITSKPLTPEPPVHHSSPRGKLIDPELLKLRSFNEQVFESDEDDVEDERELDETERYHKAALLKLTNMTEKHNASSNNSTLSRERNQLIQLHQQQRSSIGTTYSGVQGHHNEDDEDELLFAMSDMTLAKNNLEY